MAGARSRASALAFAFPWIPRTSADAAQAPALDEKRQQASGDFAAAVIG
jgi:hypothetical protein